MREIDACRRDPKRIDEYGAKTVKYGRQEMRMNTVKIKEKEFHGSRPLQPRLYIFRTPCFLARFGLDFFPFEDWGVLAFLPGGQSVGASGRTSMPSPVRHWLSGRRRLGSALPGRMTRRVKFRMTRRVQGFVWLRRRSPSRSRRLMTRGRGMASAGDPQEGTGGTG
jgi:hypothetical protein